MPLETAVIIEGIGNSHIPCFTVDMRPQGGECPEMYTVFSELGVN